MRIDDKKTDSNRLINEKSPYLLQHAHNPVDWYPWCTEAFEAALKSDKPIFLSIGYSTCHWCHVMERENFEREDVAEILNEHFISIKVDREERPDIDDVYMMPTSLITGRGGWPNSLWLTTDKKPFYAGTYFPREDATGMIGFKSLLLRLSQAWEGNRNEVETQADRIVAAMEEVSQGSSAEAKGQLNETFVKTAINEISDSFDKLSGGFGPAPKFPPHQILSLLINHCRNNANPDTLAMITKTLDCMADGGIYDHIGGGFHRYSTDSRWFLPHFEKMLYDNAQLAKIYADAHLLTGNKRYQLVAQEILDWVLRDMTDKNGGFYSALDADSEGEEGKFYLWQYEEIENILGKPRATQFAKIYGFEDSGNYKEEATGRQTGTNVAYLPQPLEEVSISQKLTLDELTNQLNQDRNKLLEARNKRIWPHLDDKILVNSNALMISSLAYCGKEFNEPRYIDAAIKATKFILEKMQVNGKLLRSYRDGQARLNAYLDDYAYFAEALLTVHNATGEKCYLDEAEAKIKIIFEHYQADEGAFFNTADNQEELLIRIKEPYDKATPSANGIITTTLLQLYQLTGEKEYNERALRLLNFYLGSMEQTPSQTATLIKAVNITNQTD